MNPSKLKCVFLALFMLLAMSVVAQEKNEKSPVHLQVKRLNDSFSNAGKTNLFYKEYEGYDHSFTDTNQQSHLVEIFMEAIGWILDK